MPQMANAAHDPAPKFVVRYLELPFMHRLPVGIDAIPAFP